MNKKSKTRIRQQEIDVDSQQWRVSENEQISRTIYLVGLIEEGLIKSVAEDLVFLSERHPREPIHMIINTYGGEVDDTFMLYDLMKYISTPIYTVGLGKIMSAGCLLLAAGRRGNRKVGRNARLMYHLGWDCIEGSIFELQSGLDAFKALEERYDKLFAEETGLSIEEVEKLYNKNGPSANKYLSAEQIIEYGVADIII